MTDIFSNVLKYNRTHTNDLTNVREFSYVEVEKIEFVEYNCWGSHENDTIILCATDTNGEKVWFRVAVNQIHHFANVKEGTIAIKSAFIKILNVNKIPIDYHVYIEFDTGPISSALTLTAITSRCYCNIPRTIKRKREDE